MCGRVAEAGAWQRRENPPHYVRGLVLITVKVLLPGKGVPNFLHRFLRRSSSSGDILATCGGGFHEMMNAGCKNDFEYPGGFLCGRFSSCFSLELLLARLRKMRSKRNVNIDIIQASPFFAPRPPRHPWPRHCFRRPCRTLPLQQINIMVSGECVSIAR
jgi:hypothetical protein